jgi:hypothetical protein
MVMAEMETSMRSWIRSWMRPAPVTITYSLLTPMARAISSHMSMS